MHGALFFEQACRSLFPNSNSCAFFQKNSPLTRQRPVVDSLRPPSSDNPPITESNLKPPASPIQKPTSVLLPSLNSASLSPGDEKTNKNIPPHSIAFGVEEIREVLGQEDSVENSSDLGLKIVSCESLSKTKSDECEKSSVQVKYDDGIDEKISDSPTQEAKPTLNSLVESSNINQPTVDVSHDYSKTDTENECEKEEPKVSLEVVSSYKPLADIFEDIRMETEDLSDQTESGDDECALSKILGR